MADPDPEPLEDLAATPAFLRRARAWSHRPVARTGVAETGTDGNPGDGPAAPPLDPASLPMPLSRRRLALIAAGLVGAWIVVAFGRQVGDAAAASSRAAELRSTTAGLQADLAALQGDLARAQTDQYVGIAAKTYGLGVRHEVPFVLDANAPSLPPDAPGSASQRVGAVIATRSPLDAWLDLLFGPDR